jgi:hypothetical protein
LASKIVICRGVETRERAAATLEKGRAAGERLFGRPSPDEMLRPAAIGGGEWSAKAEKANSSVARLCYALGASTSGFYNSNIAGWVHELAPMPCW